MERENVGISEPRNKYKVVAWYHAHGSTFATARKTQVLYCDNLQVYDRETGRLLDLATLAKVVEHRS